MNNKGSSLIECVIFLPLVILLLTQLTFISQGWSYRIQNRLISRYLSTVTLRTQVPPGKNQLQSKFDLSAMDTKNLEIKTHERTEFLIHLPLGAIRTLTIKNHYPLWRHSHERFYRFPF